jgi:hypothetical protein
MATLSSWSAHELLPLLPPGRPRAFLLGLEPIAPLPSPPAPAGFFAHLDSALDEFHRLGFFRTRTMQSELRESGVLPIFVATLARSGGTVTTIEIGASQTRARVDWETPSGEPRRLDYVQVDLSNAGLTAEARLVAELRALAPHVTFLKAASYLLAEDRFSYVRRLLIDGSDAIVQDDSGIPFRDLDTRWAKRLFGAYVAPRPPFEDRLQPALRDAFAGCSPAALPFAIGYHFDPDASNLLLASKTR